MPYFLTVIIGVISGDFFPRKMNQNEDNPLPTSSPSHNQTEKGDTPSESRSNPSFSEEFPVSNGQKLQSAPPGFLPALPPRNTSLQGEILTVPQFQHQFPILIGGIPFTLNFLEQMRSRLHTLSQAIRREVSTTPSVLRPDTLATDSMSTPLQVPIYRQQFCERGNPTLVTITLLTTLFKLERSIPAAIISARLQLTPLGTRPSSRPYEETNPLRQIRRNSRLRVQVQIQIPLAWQSDQHSSFPSPLMLIAKSKRLDSDIRLSLYTKEFSQSVSTSHLPVIQEDVTPMKSTKYISRIIMALPDMNIEDTPARISVRIRADLSGKQPSYQSGATTPQTQHSHLLYVRITLSTPVRLTGNPLPMPPSRVLILDPTMNADIPEREERLMK